MNNNNYYIEISGNYGYEYESLAETLSRQLERENRRFGTDITVLREDM